MVGTPYLPTAAANQLATPTTSDAAISQRPRATGPSSTRTARPVALTSVEETIRRAVADLNMVAAPVRVVGYSSESESMTTAITRPDRQARPAAGPRVTAMSRA